MAFTSARTVIGSTTITADNLRLGAERANSGYSAWNGTTSTVNSSGSYWSGGASYGYNYNNATVNNTSNYPSYFTAGYIYAKTGMSAGGTISASALGCLTLRVGGYDVSWKNATLRTSTGGTITIYYLGR